MVCNSAYASLRALRGLLTQAFFLLSDISWLTRAYAREVLIKIHQNPLREHSPVHFSLSRSLSARQTQSVVAAAALSISGVAPSQLQLSRSFCITFKPSVLSLQIVPKFCLPCCTISLASPCIGIPSNRTGNSDPWLTRSLRRAYASLRGNPCFLHADSATWLDR